MRPFISQDNLNAQEPINTEGKETTNEKARSNCKRSCFCYIPLAQVFDNHIWGIIAKNVSQLLVYEYQAFFLYLYWPQKLCFNQSLKEGEFKVDQHHQTLYLIHLIRSVSGFLIGAFFKNLFGTSTISVALRCCFIAWPWVAVLGSCVQMLFSNLHCFSFVCRLHILKLIYHTLNLGLGNIPENALIHLFIYSFIHSNHYLSLKKSVRFSTFALMLRYPKKAGLNCTLS